MDLFVDAARCTGCGHFADVHTKEGCTHIDGSPFGQSEHPCVCLTDRAEIVQLTPVGPRSLLRIPWSGAARQAKPATGRALFHDGGHPRSEQPAPLPSPTFHRAAGSTKPATVLASNPPMDSTNVLEAPSWIQPVHSVELLDVHETVPRPPAANAADAPKSVKSSWPRRIASDEHIAEALQSIAEATSSLPISRAATSKPWTLEEPEQVTSRENETQVTKRAKKAAKALPIMADEVITSPPAYAFGSPLRSSNPMNSLGPALVDNFLIAFDACCEWMK